MRICKKCGCALDIENMDRNAYPCQNYGFLSQKNKKRDDKK